VVGADGIKSTVLTAAAPNDLGAMNRRSVASILLAGLTGLQMHRGDGCTFGLLPTGPGVPTVLPMWSSGASTTR